MSQRFMRCAHCGLPHDVMQMVCPATGKPIPRRPPQSVGQMRVAPAQPASPSPGQVAHKSNPPPPLQSSLPPGRPTHRNLIGVNVAQKYMVRSVLGEGGMGTVYEAENTSLGRSVAMKVLHPNQARKKTAVRRFHQEARAAGAIGHPNICEVYDLGTLEDGSPFLVMERLVGETLADRIASEGGLPFDDVIDTLTQVLSGLVAAHEKGIVHRDIKPENIFLTRRVGIPPVIKLLDFGVSKMISPVLSGEREEDLDLTRTGMVMGTPFYMSPEQARGDRNLDARVDLWACGVILYEALTGKRPFIAANYNALLLQILTTKPRAARELRPALPHAFDAVLDKSMMRNREERYPSAAAFQSDLQQLRDKHPNTAIGMDVREMARQAAQRGGLARPPTPMAPIAPRPAQAQPQHHQHPQPHHQAQARQRDREPPRYEIPEGTPSSIEIPIMFSDTPMSGEQHANDDDSSSTSIEDTDLPTEISSRALSSAAVSTQRDQRDRIPSVSDTDTTERRFDLGHLSMGKRPRAGSLRGQTPPRGAIASPRPAAGSSPQAQAPQAPQPPQPQQVPPPRPAQPRVEKRPFEGRVADTEADDNNATIVQTATLLGLKRRKSPDDTLKMDSQPEIVADPPPPRSPKR